MISVYELFSNSGHTLIRCTVEEGDPICHTCNKSVKGSIGYLCIRRGDVKSFNLHKTCSELPISVYLHEHPLCLKEDFIFGEDAACHICSKPIAGSPTYTCISHDVDIDCQNFYLHRICAELPTHITHHKHNIHPLSLAPLPDGHTCDVCTRPLKTCYVCTDCDCEFDVCVTCAFEHRELQHDGHKGHALTLMKKQAFFECDACYEEAKDSSYVCTTCEFWIHKSCAFSPSIIPVPTYHHHPLTLVYSIPDIHRYFNRYCGICGKYVFKTYWVYYCHKCTYFVHMKCSTSTVSMVNENEADDIDDELDLVRFPLPSQESIFDLILTQCGKFQIDFKGEGENNFIVSTTPNDPHIIEKHWSHKIHPLQQLQFTISENDSDESDDDRRVLICNGCIQPITVSHPSYYTCIQCGFFLHSFCATKLPQKLPVGASHFHPNHSLLLQKTDKFYNFVICGVCDTWTNGFYYHCQTCDICIDIRCAFLPTRIKHKSHKHHSLVQRPSPNSPCRVGGCEIVDGVEYACETCSSFQIHICCVILPSRKEHKYEIHPLTLRYPPFFYEGAFYCEICEERVDNQKLLYHCSESEHSFHCNCLDLFNNAKFGGTIKVTIVDKPHTLALVLKRPTRKHSTFTCFHCSVFFHSIIYIFECDGCGVLACARCASKLSGE